MEPPLNSNLVGQICALLTAITWAGAIVCFKHSGERMPPLALNIFKNTVGSILLLLTLLLYPPCREGLGKLSATDWWVLAGSGILGIAIADTVFFAALNLCGVGLISIVDCAYSPFVLLFAFLMLGETLRLPHYVGGVAILIGILIASRHPLPANRTRAQIFAGVSLGVLSMAMMALAIVWAKPTIEPLPLIPVTTIRMGAGTAALVLYAAASPRRREHLQDLRPARVWWYSAAGAVLGAYLSMMFWLGGYKWTKASIAALLNQTSVIFALILAAIFLHERFTSRKFAAVTMALAGVLVIALADSPEAALQNGETSPSP